jgi:hypothetical protein
MARLRVKNACVYVHIFLPGVDGCGDNLGKSRMKRKRAGHHQAKEVAGPAKFSAVDYSDTARTA